MEQLYWRTKDGDYVDVDDMSKPMLKDALKSILRASKKTDDETLKLIALDGELSDVLQL